MAHETHSPNYRTVRLSYPKELQMKCPICGSLVHFEYSDAGKFVHCLDEIIQQIRDLYRCTSKNCELSHLFFNPAPRFDYGGRRWGVDVLQLIGKLFLQAKAKPDQILTLIHLDHPTFEISEDSIRRICDDLLELKAFRIDEHTMDIILAQNMILLGLDGQDPGADNDSLWLFVDLLSGRILATIFFESVSHESLHLYLEELFRHYKVPIVGWVSDKQNVIVKCHDTYYAEIPHQYCQFHFLNHLWSHLELLDSQIFLPLKKMICHLYIHNTTNAVEFEGHGKIKIKEVFKPIDNDLQTMIKVRNKTFKELRGLWLFSTLNDYYERMNTNVKKMNSHLRGTKIMRKTTIKIHESLRKLKNIYDQVHELFEKFQNIRKIFNTTSLEWQEQQRQCDEIFKQCWSEAVAVNPSLCLEDCRAFLPHKNTSFPQILAEWCRLWNSYLPGLFQYHRFPGVWRTNGVLERLFSLEKCALITRAGKGNVNHMIATRGEAYLRIMHCDQNELSGSYLIEFQEELVKALREQLKDRISKQTSKWRTRERTYSEFSGVSIYIESEKKTKMEVR